jgi:hypothetical protein
MAMRPTFAMLTCASILASAACSRGGSPSDAPEGAAGEADGASEVGEAGEAGEPGEGQGDAAALGEGEIVGKELPAELVAELRKQGDDTHGRLLTLAPGFMATAECSDCGAPSYLWFVAVRCSDSRHCDVLTEVCEGTIAREAELYSLEFRAVEGSGEGSAETCASYTGSFEAP